MKPRMIVLFGLIVFLVLVSACKPEARNSLAQPTVALPARPVLPEPAANAATTVTATSVLSKPPVCQFKSAITETPTVKESYIFSDPSVVYTRTGSGILSIYGWLPDNNQLMINGYDKNIDRYTIEFLDVPTGKTHRYVERQSPGRIGWLPQQQALAYVDSEQINSATGTVRRDLWISKGDPNQVKQIVSGINDESLTIDAAGRLVFFTQDQSDQPSGSQLQQMDATTQARQVLPLDLAQWELPHYPRFNMPADPQNRRLLSVWRPGTDSQILYYFSDLGALLADTQTGLICEIELLQQNARVVPIHATWSPDGRYLATLVEPAGNSRHFPSLLVIDMNTGQQFTPDLGDAASVGASIIDIEWAANGQSLIALRQVVLSNASGDIKYELYLLDVPAHTTQQILSKATIGGGSGGSSEMSWSPDGHYLAVNCPTRSPGKPIIEDHICLISVSTAP